MADDLSVESASLLTASGGLTRASGPMPRTEGAFKAKRGDLSAFGALGSLMHAQTQVGKAMDDLAEAAAAIRGEWDSEADILQTIGQAFADLDQALAGNTPKPHGHRPDL